MGLDGVRAALMLGAMRSLIAVPPSFTMQLPLSGVALGVVVGVGVGSATSCVGVGLAGGSVAVGVTVAVGAVNLFDKGAPLTLGAFNDDYDTSLHSNRGRFLYTDITLRF